MCFKTHRHTHRHTQTHTDTHTHTQTHTHRHTHTQPHMQTQTQTRTHIHTHLILRQYKNKDKDKALAFKGMSVEFRHAYPETISLVRGVLIRGAIANLEVLLNQQSAWWHPTTHDFVHRACVLGATLALCVGAGLGCFAGAAQRCVARFREALGAGDAGFFQLTTWAPQSG